MREAKRKAAVAVAGMMLLLLLAFPAASSATFPGENGKLTWNFFGTDCDWDGGDESIYTVEPDGTGLDNTFSGCQPAWSPNGKTLAYWAATTDASEGTNIWFERIGRSTGPSGWHPAWAPNGTAIVWQRYIGPDQGLSISDYGVRPHTTRELTSQCDHSPAWSPADGLIAFVRSCGAQPGIYLIAPDGDGEFFLTTGDDPNWSPDGTALAFSDTRDGNQEIYTIELAPPRSVQRVTNNPAADIYPAWSPDATEIAFSSDRDRLAGSSSSDIYAWDGTSVRRITTGQRAMQLEWQVKPGPDPLEGGFVRPRGATPFRVPLVPAYRPCAAPNREHGPPLAFASCSPPAESSPRVSLATADSHTGMATEGVGHVRLDTLRGAPGGTDDTDLRISIQVQNVICTGATTCNGRDYTGQLRGELRFRLTDRNNDAMLGGGTDGATTQDFAVRDMFMSCAATADPARGSTCSLSTTADAVRPYGWAMERRRQIMQLDAVQVFDGGSSGFGFEGVPFLTQGVFVP